MTDTAAAHQNAVPAAPEPGPPEPSRRSNRSIRDMALSLVVLLIPLTLVVLVFRARGGEDVVVVDPGPAIAAAQRSGRLPVAVPAGLSDGWRPVSADFSAAGTLRVGYLTPSGGAIQLVESSEPVDPLLIRELGDDVRPTGVVAIGTVTWDSYAARGDQALVLRSSRRTLIIIGQAPADDMHALASALR